MAIKYTKELLENIVAESNSIADVIRKLNLRLSGGNYSHIKRRILIYNISMLHFTGQSWNKGLKLPKRTKEEFIEHFLCKYCSFTNSHSLKLKLYEFGLKDKRCEKCNIGTEWNGEYLSLHLDHIDGDNTNNTIENLRILCPNCHSQTSTYAGKRNKNKIIFTKQQKLENLNRHCVDCSCLVTQKAIRCKSCKMLKQEKEKRTFEIPSKEDLAKMIKDTNFSKVAKKYNVSDNAVRKWCTKYSLSIHASDYKISP